MRMQMSIKDLYIMEQIKYRGYEYIVRLFNGYYCGYVAIPPGHRFFKKHYDQVNLSINCHGGLTFSDFFSDHESWFIGFDCAHAFDRPQVQNDVYVAKECMKIIDQIVAMDGDA